MSTFSFTSMTMTPVSSNATANANNYNAYSSFLSSSSAFTPPVVKQSSHEAPMSFTRKRTWGDEESGDETPSAPSLLMPSGNSESPNNNDAKRPRGPLGDITNLYRC
jgi:hypothetical protein